MIGIEQKETDVYAAAGSRGVNAASMIPSFDEFGFLPPGIHLATLDEIDARFGHCRSFAESRWSQFDG